jgi:hypothetical protein
MSKVLCTVGALALVFTTVNVTRFATSRGVPLPIAILLDPMIGTALAGVLYVDARLAAWGIRPPGWSTTLRWSTGCTAALMNTWQSLWPDGRIGWPQHADPAAVLLHLTPALLLITLTETIAAYRKTINDLLGSRTQADPRLDRPRAAAQQTMPTHADRNATKRSASANGPNGPAEVGALTFGPRPESSPTPNRNDPPPNATHSDTAIWLRAIALNDTALATTGNPVSIWRLRTDLRVGPKRARQIRERLLTDRPDPL